MSKTATKSLTVSKKPAAKAAPVAPKGKTVRKADAAKPTFTGKKLPAGSKVHVIAEEARPASGQLLFAHTHAALAALGLLEAARPAVPKQHVLTLMGQRAVTYHTKKQNFEAAPNHGIRLSVTGRNWFVGRFAEGKVDANLANAFMALFTDGKAAGQTGVAQANVYETKLAA